MGKTVFGNWKSLILIIFLLNSYLFVSAQTGPLGKAGTIAHYKLDDSLDDRPEFETKNKLSVVKATIRLGPVFKEKGEKKFQWYGLQFTRINGESYQMWILLDSWPTVTHDPVVKQYLWHEPDWSDALNFVHEVTGEPQLPRLNLWTYGWPQIAQPGAGSERAPVQGMPDQIHLQGFNFIRISLEKKKNIEPPVEYTTIELNPDLLIGWVYYPRDKKGQPHYRIEGGYYTYINKSVQDMDEHVSAGFNFYVSRGKKPVQPTNLHRSHIYHSNMNSGEKFLDWPADLYRSNYWGNSNHIDEPGVRNFGFNFLNYKDKMNTLPEVLTTESLQRIVRDQLKKASGGRTGINKYDGERFSFGDIWMKESASTIVTWEYEWPTAWYQLAVEDGVGGIVDEDAFNEDLVETYNMGLGTQIPPTIENASRIRIAVLRGAARNFNKSWGIAIYHPNEVKYKSETLNYFYNKGARYLWFWTSWGEPDKAGLPYTYQRYYATMMQEAFERNPDCDMNALRHAAKVAVVIPYGYTFSPYHMHRSSSLHLERENQYGIKYREVLSNAAMEVERLIRSGIDFDIAVDDSLFHKTGYNELIYAQADGKIRIEKKGEGVEILDQPRPFERPELGKGPELSLEIIESENDESDEIRFRAIAEIGTGEWAEERVEPRISWEVYHPDGTVSPAIFPEYGQEKTLHVADNKTYTLQHPVPEHLRRQSLKEIPVEGSYTVRAAVADIFGRPAVAYKTIYVENPSLD